MDEFIESDDPYIGTWRKARYGVYYIERGRAWDNDKQHWINYHCCYADLWTTDPLWGMKKFTLGIIPLEENSIPWRICVNCEKYPVTSDTDYLCYGCRHE